ncbi:MAG: hypothetical protein ACRDYX_08695 [Egibacteraceae bacterium]
MSPEVVLISAGILCLLFAIIGTVFSKELEPVLKLTAQVRVALGACGIILFIVGLFVEGSIGLFGLRNVGRDGSTAPPTPSTETVLPTTPSPPPCPPATQQSDGFSGNVVDLHKWEPPTNSKLIYAANGVLNLKVAADDSTESIGAELVSRPVGRPVCEVSFITTVLSYQGDKPGGAGITVEHEDGRDHSVDIGPGPDGPGIEYSICKKEQCSGNYGDYDHEGMAVKVGEVKKIRLLWTGGKLQIYIDEALWAEAPDNQTPIAKVRLGLYGDPGSVYHATIDDVLITYAHG